MCLYDVGDTHTALCIWRSQNNFSESILSSVLSVDDMDQSDVGRPG